MSKYQNSLVKDIENYSKSKNVKIQLDLKAAVFELDSSYWSSSHYTCPYSLPQSLEKIWWLFEKLLKPAMLYAVVSCGVCTRVARPGTGHIIRGC